MILLFICFFTIFTLSTNDSSLSFTSTASLLTTALPPAHAINISIKPTVYTEVYNCPVCCHRLLTVNNLWCCCRGCSIDNIHGCSNCNNKFTTRFISSRIKGARQIKMSLVKCRDSRAVNSIISGSMRLISKRIMQEPMLNLLR